MRPLINDLAYSLYISKDGLLNSKTDIKETEENSALYSEEYLFLQKDNNIEHDPELIKATKIWWQKCKVSKGLYGQKYELNGTKEDLMSPDQILSLVAYLLRIGNKKEIKEVWHYLWTHCFTYCNVTAEISQKNKIYKYVAGKINFRRIMQPQAILMTALAAHPYLLFFLWPILSVICLSAFRQPIGTTSGELKSYVVTKALNMYFTYWIGTKFNLLTQKESWKDILTVYFPEGHPNRRFLK